MKPEFVLHEQLELPGAPRYGFGRCDCRGCVPRQPQRRLFTGLLAAGATLGALPALAQDREGVDVGDKSWMTRLVPAEQVEAAAAQQYAQMTRQAAQQHALAPPNHPQALRLRTIAKRIIPLALPWNPRARDWKWEVNLIGSSQLNAFCMPGGKIAFYYGILEKLKLSDDEVAMIMGPETAHALREHARERMAKSMATRAGVVRTRSSARASARCSPLGRKSIVRNPCRDPRSRQAPSSPPRPIPSCPAAP